MAEVRQTARARKDLGDLWLHVAQTQSPAHADRLLDRIGASAEMLAGMPRVGRSRPQLGEGMRSWPVGHYQLLYQPLGTGIQLVRVLHSRRDPQAPAE